MPSLSDARRLCLVPKTEADEDVLDKNIHLARGSAKLHLASPLLRERSNRTKKELHSVQLYFILICC